MESTESQSEQTRPTAQLHARSSVTVLVVSKNGNVSNQIRGALKNLGFAKLSAVPSHVQALDRIRSRSFNLIIFECAGSDMPALDFVKQCSDLDPSQLLIALSSSPRIDDVFGLLRAGARGFVVPPFTIGALEDVMKRADEGPPFSEAVLHASDRNAALSSVILNNLYRVATLLRQCREFDSARRELERHRSAFSEAVDMARMFCERGDEEMLRAKIMEDCIARANTAASRLGRARQRLQKERTQAKKSGESEADTESSNDA